MALLGYWTAYDDAAARLWRALGLLAVPTSHAFEHATPVGGGRGKASMTDLMLFGSTAVAAIEAKWNEPTYPKVVDWLSRGRDRNNRARVLDYWLDSIKSFGNPAIDHRAYDDVVYQAIHRTAAACIAARKHRCSATVGYLVFGDDRAKPTIDSVKSTVERLVDVIKPGPTLVIKAIHVGMQTLPMHATLAADLARMGRDEGARQSKQQLRARTLFDFREPVPIALASR
jgi:hypothetical protein